MKIYVTGSQGRLGYSVIKKLVAKLKKSIPNKDSIICLVRNIPISSSNDVQFLITDFSQSELTKILADADVLIHLAGSTNTLDKKELYESNFELTRTLVSSLPKKTRIIFASSISVYGKKLLEMPATEETPCNPDSDYSKSKFEAEKFVISSPNHIVLRIGTIYGAQFTDYFKIFRLIEKNKMRKIGEGKNFIPFVHVDDISDAIVASIQNGKGTYILARSQLTQEDILNLAANFLGCDPISKHINLGFTRLLVKIYEQYCKFFHKKPFITLEHIDVLGFNRIFDSKKAESDLRFHNRDLKIGIKEMVDCYRNDKTKFSN